MKNVIKGLILAVFLGTTAFVSPALAYTPSLSATSQGNGSILLSISNANPYSQINLSSRQTSALWTIVNNIGQTDANGNFSQVVNLPSDGSTNPILIYVTVGNLQSATVSVYPNSSGCYGTNCGGCTYSCGGNSLILSQTNIYLSVGQTQIVTPTNSYYGNLYVSSNPNSTIAAAVTSGNGISIYGQSVGNDSIIVCANGSSSCATVYVYVTGSTCYSGNCGSGSLTFSQSSVNINIGQTASVTAYNSNGSLYVSSNSNSSAATVSLSSNQINIYGNYAGTASVVICSSYNSCGTLYITVGGSSGYGSIALNPSSLSLTSPQTSTVSITSGIYGSTYYISSNSNPSVANATISGSILYINSLVGGNTTVVVCQSSSSVQCASLYVTVNGGSCPTYGCGGCTYNCSGTLTFSPSPVNLNLGQSGTVNIYNSYSGASFYISSNSNSSVASASISGSSLYLLAGSVGNTNIVVCQSGNASVCGTLYVNVNSLGGSGTLTLSQTSLNLISGQSSSITAYGGSSIYVSSNSNPSVATYSISGSQLNIIGSGIGSTTFSVCSNSGYGCASLYITVNSGSCAYYGCNNGSISLSQSSLSLGGGQSSAVTIYGNGSYYISSNTNSTVANAALAGNILNVTGIQSGTTSVYICQNGGSGQCVTLYVTVSGGIGYYGTTNVVLSQTSLNLSVGQTATVNASGNGGYGYYLSNNSNPGAVNASFNGSVLSVYGLQSGSTTLQICQNNASACASLYITVGNGSSGIGLQYPGGTVLGASTYPNGQLIAEGQAVYIVYKNTKTGFVSAPVFTGLGFSFNNVIQVGSSGLPNSGYVVSTAYASHPWGSWVKSGQTVYFVNELGLIPVPDWSTFLNNGGSANLIVSANSYDLRLPILSPMVYSDPRLQ